VTRRCPFCSSENDAAARVCAACARALPPGPTSRAPSGGRPPARVTAPLVVDRVPGVIAGGGKRASTPPPPLPAMRRPSTPPPPTATTPTAVAASAAPARPSSDPTVLPPPTRQVIAGPDGRELVPPPVDPVPDAPDGGVYATARYAVLFARSRWQRGKALGFHKERVREDTRLLDGVLFELGTQIRALGIENRATAGPMKDIEDAEARRAGLGGETVDLQRRQGEENARFAEMAAERSAKAEDAERALARAVADLEGLEAQRRGLRDKRKAIERQQKAAVDAAEKREHEAGKLPLGDERSALRRSSEEHRREAAQLDPERQDAERKLAALDRPVAQATAMVESLKAELAAARRSLEDAREGHRHRLAELGAEQGRKGKELEAAAGEIHQKLVTLGTIVNLHRVERPELDALYDRIDALRAAISERSRLIDRLGTERSSYERSALVRGVATLFLAVVLLFTIGLILVAMP
jgi:hypothetical protein